MASIAIWQNCKSSQEIGKYKKHKIAFLYFPLISITKINHPKFESIHLVCTDIIERRFERGSISYNRKTIPDDIEKLCKIGIDIEEECSRGNLYSLNSHIFTLPEIKLLVDADNSSKFIIPKKSIDLVKKLAVMTSNNQSDALIRNIYINKIVKPDNEQIFYLVDNINTAINNGKKISSKCFHYDENRNQAPNNNGKRYYFSPYHLVWNDNYYYVIGYCDKHKKIATYRVDHTKEISMLETAVLPYSDGYNLPDFAVFDMYDGEKEQVTLICKNNMMNYIVDRFGDDAETSSIDCGHFKVITEVSVSQTFLAWMLQFNGDIRIVSPKTLMNRYESMLKKALE